MPELIANLFVPRLLLALVLSAAAVSAQPDYDFLIQGGHLIDPKNNIDQVMDVAIQEGTIRRVAQSIPASEAKQIIPARGPSQEFCRVYKKTRRIVRPRAAPAAQARPAA